MLDDSIPFSDTGENITYFILLCVLLILASTTLTLLGSCNKLWQICKDRLNFIEVNDSFPFAIGCAHAD